jgi:multicomponent K+:H+ antiporter subunit D
VTAHLAVLPILVPLFAGALLLLAGDERIRLARAAGLGSTAVQLLVAVAIVARAASGEVDVYSLGNWPAPFGIVLVVDRLAALMLVLTTVVALAALAYAVCGWDRHGRHFHAFFQFQLMGLAGAFLTGDLFNLFVFFEVLLIASYCLLVHGHGPERLKAGIHYVVLNLIGSALFLVAVSLLYAVTGTLNMADLAVRVPQIAPTDVPFAKAAALMLLVVFGLKAALFPLYFWLPTGYAAAAAPVAALFAIMTKVGAYSIVRVFSLVFGPDAGALALVASPWLLPVGLVTIAAGAAGALAAQTLRGLVAYLTVVSAGTIAAALSLATAESLSATLFYLVHSTLVTAALFVLAELVAAQRGDTADALRPAAPVAQPALLGALMMLLAASAAGLPPFSGFLGKVLILQSALPTAHAPAVWTTLLVAGLASVVVLARAGSNLFWKVLPGAPVTAAGASFAATAPAVILAGAGVLMALLAGPVKTFTDATAADLAAPSRYAERVLGPGYDPRATVRPLPAEERPAR